MKLLENLRSEIEGHPQKTFQFGETDQHQVLHLLLTITPTPTFVCVVKLDVHYPDPAADSVDIPVPVLFFIYGDGFAGGDRKYKAPFDLGYAHLSTFFAKHSDPALVEDICDAIAWVLANAPTIASAAPSTIPASTALSSFFVFGHSAGANHLPSLYLSPSLLPLNSPMRAATHGLVPQGGPIVDGYYGSQAQAQARMPEFFVLKSEMEPALVDKGNDGLVEALKGRTGRKVKYEVMKGHNHFSLHCALMSGEGEEWGADVAAWINAKV